MSVRFRENGTWGAWAGIGAGLLQNGSYRVQAENGTQWRITTPSGYGDFGPANSSWFHMSTDRASFYMGNSLHVNGSIYRYGTNYAIDSDGFYVDASASRIRANPNTYTAFEAYGSKGGYGGMREATGGVCWMFDGSGNGGFYREASGLWYQYFNLANSCLALGGSTTSSSYELYVSGAIYATGNIVAYSDARVKENVQTIDSALMKVDQLRGVYYNRIGDATKKRQVGVIAQELNEVLPEAVTYAADVDSYGVAYGNIVGLLIEAIKELKAEVAELKRTH
jgi:hypothetical protein